MLTGTVYAIGGVFFFILLTEIASDVIEWQRIRSQSDKDALDFLKKTAANVKE